MFPLWFTICFDAVTLLELRSISYISLLWFTTCFGAKSIIISINQFTQATISVACLVIEPIAPALFSTVHFACVIWVTCWAFTLQDARGHHHQISWDSLWIDMSGWVSARLCSRQYVSTGAGPPPINWTDQHYIITYISYITLHLSEGIRNSKERARA